MLNKLLCIHRNTNLKSNPNNMYSEDCNDAGQKYTLHNLLHNVCVLFIRYVIISSNAKPINLETYRIYYSYEKRGKRKHIFRVSLNAKRKLKIILCKQSICLRKKEVYEAIYKVRIFFDY